MPTRLLIPGYLGSGPGHWQHYWEMDDPSSIRVEQDSWDAPDLDQWRERLESQLKIYPGATLVAHSLGSVLVAELARTSGAPSCWGRTFGGPLRPVAGPSQTSGPYRFRCHAGSPAPFPDSGGSQPQTILTCPLRKSIAILPSGEANWWILATLAISTLPAASGAGSQLMIWRTNSNGLEPVSMLRPVSPMYPRYDRTPPPH